MHFGITSWFEHGLKIVLRRFYLWSNQGIIMLSTYASRTIHIYWWLFDYYYIEKTTYPPSGNLVHHHVAACCPFAAEPLHDWMTAQMAMRLTLRSFKHEKCIVSIFEEILGHRPVRRHPCFTQKFLIKYGMSPPHPHPPSPPPLPHESWPNQTPSRPLGHILHTFILEVK